MAKIKIKSENKTPVKKKACETKCNQKEKTDSAVESFVDEIQEVLNKYQRKLIF